jgi:hypothetical protein
MIKILMPGRSDLLGGYPIRKAAAEKVLKNELRDCTAGIQRAYPKA